MTNCFECDRPGGMWGLCESCQADRMARVRASLSSSGTSESESGGRQSALGDFGGAA